MQNNTWPFSHCLSLLSQHNQALADQWLLVLWDGVADQYNPDALTADNLRLIERDVMQQQLQAQILS